MKFCPQCHLLLTTTDCAGTPVLICSGCGGCWFTRDELDSLVKDHGTEFGELDQRYAGEPRFENYAGLTAYCPECRTQALVTLKDSSGSGQFGQVCDRCGGVWLHSGSRKLFAEQSPEQTSVQEPTDAPITVEEYTEPIETTRTLLPDTETDHDLTYPEKEAPELNEISLSSDYLAANQEYASSFVHGHLPRIPARKLAIVTCMDARMQVYEILGLKPSDANVIRNAGGIVTEDVLRSLIVSHHLLGTQEFIIINHTDCGLLVIDEEEFRDRLTEQSGSAEVVPSVFYAFKDLEKNVRRQVQKIKSHPWIPKEITVRGFVYDVRSGRLTEITESQGTATGAGSLAKEE